MYDLVIRGGHIVDGTGAAPFIGDVAVRGGLIVAIGEVNGKGAEEIDASGQIVTPALSTFTPIMMARQHGIRKWPHPAGMASPPSSWAIAASALPPLRPNGMNGLSA